MALPSPQNPKYIGKNDLHLYQMTEGGLSAAESARKCSKKMNSKKDKKEGK